MPLQSSSSRSLKTHSKEDIINRQHVKIYIDKRVTHIKGEVPVRTSSPLRRAGGISERPEPRKNVSKPPKNPDADLSAELEALFAKYRPIEELDLKGLAEAFEQLNRCPDFVADTCKAALVEDVLRAIDEDGITKSELARRLGKSRQQLGALLDETKRNNFTIDTMAQISTALGRKLIVRMPPKGGPS